MIYLRGVELKADDIPDELRSRYPFSVPSIKSMGRLDFDSNVTFFVGENGSGKSTLLEAIAEQCGFNPAGGGRSNAYEVESSGASSLTQFLRLSWLPKISNGFFLRAETFYQFASHIDTMPESLPYYGGRSLHAQSHGESFLSLFANRFGGRAIYLLDEPEAALSPARQLALMRVIKDLEHSAQFIIATHSPILLGYPDARIINFDEQPISEIRYEDTLHYVITRRFLDNREATLRDLFDDEE